MQPARQTRLDSFLEALTNTFIGYWIAVLANHLVLPLFGYTPSFAESNGIAAIFTLISIARSYILRRLFNGKTPYAWLRARFIKAS